MLDEILARRVIIVLGKGGVGKTSLSAAIGKLAASTGREALVMESDARAPMAAMFGVAASFEPVQVAPRLSLMVLDGRHSLEEYLRMVVPGRMLLKAVFASRLYQFFVQAAPGLRELMMLGKIYYEAEAKTSKQTTKQTAKPADRKMIVVDAPSSGVALSLLQMPTAARATFGDSVVGKEANHISQMLRDRRHCAIVQVTTADGLSLSETIETHAQLTRMHLAPMAVLFNRTISAGFDARDVGALTGRHGIGASRKRMEHLAELAKSELKRGAEARRAIGHIESVCKTPVIEIGEHTGLAGMELIDQLMLDLAASRGARPRARASEESRSRAH